MGGLILKIFSIQKQLKKLYLILLYAVFRMVVIKQHVHYSMIFKNSNATFWHFILKYIINSTFYILLTWTFRPFLKKYAYCTYILKYQEYCFTLAPGLPLTKEIEISPFSKIKLISY